ncbi:sugar ABC transporter permease [Palleronia sediminis]|uniref:Transport permease protein n=1 Tax=Palleronia sediminis TaxID=2547833 RepID=A0A4R6A0Z3_9RHOB|nr:ABC transporter permease [Palleronia sediminis]TDL76224.1 sugar ABC transporter permease [Palleronia sediminis]
MTNQTDETGGLPPGVANLQGSGNVAGRGSFLRSITALVLREMMTKYGRSPGGYVWALLEPIGMIVVLSFAFALVLRTPSLGNSFVLFYASGYLPFTMFMKLNTGSATSMRKSKSLLSFPAISWFDAILSNAILTVMTQLLVTYIILMGILVLTDVSAHIDPVPVVEAMGLAALLGVGVGTTVCALAGLYPLFLQVWKIVTRPLLLASAVLYILEDMPGIARDILWWNPVVHITGLARTGVFPTYTGGYISVAYVVFVSLVLLAFGLALLGRYHQEILRE